MRLNSKFARFVLSPEYYDTTYFQNDALMKPRSFVICGLLLLFAHASFAYTPTAPPFATQIYIGADCGYGGEVEYEITDGNPGLYTYYWEHGPTSLHLTGLAPGFYWLHVINYYGCEEIYKVEIVRLDKCEIDSEIVPGIRKCRFEATITVYNPYTQVVYNPDLFEIEWSDGYTGGFTRSLRQYNYDVSYYITVTSRDRNGEICCMAMDTIVIYGDDDCKVSAEKETVVIVNEYNGKGGKHGQFIELLVLGNGVCGDSMDLRGYILDDNNGSLVQGNDVIVPVNSYHVGINQGFIQFYYDDVWKAVPNGSLIVMYESLADPSVDFPNDDPTDTDSDGVYVLHIGDDNYLYGKSGSWNYAERVMDYNGLFVAPTWELLRISNPADGIQVLNSEKVLSHGLSVGSSPFSSDYEFRLHLGGNHPENMNCKFVLSDYWDNDHFVCNTGDDIAASPGLPNSIDNELLIRDLRVCDTIPPLSLRMVPPAEEPALATKAPSSSNALTIYPNPFRDQVTLAVDAYQEGEATLEVFAPSGAQIFRKAWHISVGGNKLVIDDFKPLPTSLYLTRFTFPSGEVAHGRIMHIQY